MIQRTVLRQFLVPFVFLFLPLLSFAFQEGSATAQDTVQVQKPEPISVNRLVGEMEELRGLIELNKKKIEPTSRLKRIDSLYTVFNDLIGEEQAKAQEFVTSNPAKFRPNTNQCSNVLGTMDVGEMLVINKGCCGRKKVP